MVHKKQAYELIQDICDINENVWGNKHGSYQDEVEAAYQIEEALEGLDDLHYLSGSVEAKSDSPKDVSRAIIDLATNDTGTSEIPNVDRFDKALDAVYFAIGSLHKLGLHPEDIVDGLQIVHNANRAKTGEKDAEGKVTKPKGFVPPEELLQKILDNRGIK